MSIKNLLKDEIESEMEEIGKLPVGDDQYKVAVDGVCKLIDKQLEIEKFEAGENNKMIDRELDRNFKNTQQKYEKIDGIIKHVLTGLGICVTAGVTIWGALRTFEFEEEGTIASKTGRIFIDRLFKSK